MVIWFDGLMVKQSFEMVRWLDSGTSQRVGWWIWLHLSSATAYLPAHCPSFWFLCLRPVFLQVVVSSPPIIFSLPPWVFIHPTSFSEEQHHHSSYISDVIISTIMLVTPFNRFFISLHSLLCIANSFIPILWIANNNWQVKDVSYNEIRLPCGWSNFFVLK